MKWLLACLFLVGCQVQLKEDPTPISAKDAGYPTAEMKVNGLLVSGMALATVTLGDKWDDFDLRIQGYSSGTVYVTSKGCDVEYSAVYKDNQLIKIPLTGTITKSCVFGIVVGLQLPDEEANGIRVYPLIGWVAVKALPHRDDEWLGMSKKGTASQWTINSGDTKPVTVMLNGCGTLVKQKFTPVSGKFTIPLKDPNMKPCVLDGVVLSQDYKNINLSALIIDYNSQYLPLPIPALSQKDGKLQVTMDQSVSLMALDTDYVFDNTNSWEFDTSKSHVLRGATVKGRIIIGVYDKGAWKWIQ